ncbi:MULTISPECIES: hypothetical protein [Burkholderia]|uniref:hypothetical protein n=1 Tax=Burkholderia TaxID=32008 RepID=UPI000D005230|nr:MULTISPECIES: hypothetical protein [Burkholderia]PRE81284.1 hypothetical protein C6Q13_24850 [Burkholderia gladioli]PRG43791.1 hypothetical protein C6T62_09020 [Burkholderia multivorans]
MAASKDQMFPDLFANTRDGYNAINTRGNNHLESLFAAVLLDCNTGIESLNRRGGYEARNVALYDVLDVADASVVLYQYRVTYKKKSTYFTEVEKTYYLALVEKNKNGVKVITDEVEVEDFSSNKILATLRGKASPLKRLASEAYADTQAGKALKRYVETAELRGAVAEATSDLGLETRERSRL